MFLLLTRQSYRSSSGVGMHIHLYCLPLLLVLTQCFSPYLIHGGQTFFFPGFLQLQRAYSPFFMLVVGGISSRSSSISRNSSNSKLVYSVSQQGQLECYQHNRFLSYKPIATFMYPLMVNLLRGSGVGDYVNCSSTDKRILGIFSKFFSL
jgi:hypothetical protein